MSIRLCRRGQEELSPSRVALLCLFSGALIILYIGVHQAHYPPTLSDSSAVGCRIHLSLAPHAHRNQQCVSEFFNPILSIFKACPSSSIPLVCARSLTFHPGKPLFLLTIVTAWKPCSAFFFLFWRLPSLPCEHWNRNTAPMCLLLF